MPRTPRANAVGTPTKLGTPYDTRSYRIAAEEIGPTGGPASNTPAGRKKFSRRPPADDPRRPRSARPRTDSSAAAPSAGTALASDGTAPADTPALLRSHGTAAAPSTPTSPAPPPGTPHCNSAAGHSRVGIDARNPPTGKSATADNRWELVLPLVRDHAAKNPRELLLPKVKSRRGLRLLSETLLLGGLILRPHSPSA
jgi:hypothetical protein